MTDTTAISNLSSPGVTAPPTYSGPKEVLLNKPVTLKGTYDAARIAQVTLSAEDKFPLNITTNAGTWQLTLPSGFSTAGSRWLRLKGFDSKGQVVENRVFYITVSSDPLTIGQSLTLKVLQDTFFKAAPADSSTLSDQQKVLVKAGQTFSVNRYGSIDGHIKLELGEEIAPIGNFGYFYDSHVQLSKGTQIFRFNVEEVPNISLTAQLVITTTTILKANLGDSSTLAANQKIDAAAGQTYAITGYACANGHFRVRLADPIAGFGDTAFVYWKYSQVKRNGKSIPYDSDALTVTALTSTILKKRPVDSSQLQASERANLNTGNLYGVSSYAIQGGHIKVALTEELPGFGNTGFVFPSFVQMKRGGRPFNPIPPTVEINVPYFSQRDNPRYYWATCNVTSIAMVFYYYGIRPKNGGQLEDELLQWCLNKGGEGAQTNHNVLSQLIQAYGFKPSFNTNRTWQEVKEELINGRPVVLCGLFTHGGHIITAIGFTSQGYIVNDPWGDAMSGYSNTEGRKRLYPYSYVDEVAGPDGKVWAHFISK
jgi:uncharacterized protein YvpB